MQYFSLWSQKKAMSRIEIIYIINPKIIEIIQEYLYQSTLYLLL